jgi:hypothetical protein
VDCFEPSATNGSGPIPSKFAWPQILANELGMECVNMSKPGASNKEILNSLLNFNFNALDVVVTMWSFIERWCILDFNIIYNSFSFNNSKIDTIMQFDKVFTITDLQLDFIYRANFAKMYLDNKNLKNYHLSVKPKDCCPEIMPVWNTVDFVNIDLTLISSQTPTALDTAHGRPHPGPEAHRIVAMKLCKEISNAHNK